jgi:hypothetical protein
MRRYEESRALLARSAPKLAHGGWSALPASQEELWRPGYPKSNAETLVFTLASRVRAGLADDAAPATGAHPETIGSVWAIQ